MPLPRDTVQPEALPDAVLLATTGGLLDAVVYLNHGHVFANAMFRQRHLPRHRHPGS